MKEGEDNIKRVVVSKQELVSAHKNDPVRGKELLLLWYEGRQAEADNESGSTARIELSVECAELCVEIGDFELARQEANDAADNVDNDHSLDEIKRVMFCERLQNVWDKIE